MTEEKWRELFGFNLSNYLKHNNMTQRDLTDLTYISESIISDYVRGRRTPSAIKILRIAQALKCTTDDLIDFGEMID